MKKQSRIAIVITLVVSLLCAGLVRQLAEIKRENASNTGRGATAGSRRTSLSSMNSFALALLLGGLRGPLVMVLWTQSEQQKQEKNLEGFDTRIEWIRLLQPEFDTVHIFQSWNKAYNISVQMASLANKYTTILDAIDYLHNVDAERPDDINIIYSIAQIYFDKLGNSSEKAYYRRRVREESMPHASRQKLNRDDPSWRRLEIDSIVDADGNVLANLLSPTHPRPANVPASADWYDGSEMQFLKPFEPYKTGVSPFAIAYNYYKRSQMLQVLGKQTHAQLSESVIHSRPALALKNWSEEEWEFGRQKELLGFGAPVPAEKNSLEVAAGSFAAERVPNDPASLDKALFSYDRSARLAKAAKDEYEYHLQGSYANSHAQYIAHMDQLDAQVYHLQADADYLRLRTAPENSLADLKKSVIANYQQAVRHWAALVVRYYIEPEAIPVLFPDRVVPSTEELLKMSDQKLATLLQASKQIAIQARGGHYSNEDREEYEAYIARGAQRLQKLNP